jgi:hypothetical protein
MIKNNPGRPTPGDRAGKERDVLRHKGMNYHYGFLHFATATDAGLDNNSLRKKFEMRFFFVREILKKIQKKCKIFLAVLQR